MFSTRLITLALAALAAPAPAQESSVATELVSVREQNLSRKGAVRQIADLGKGSIREVYDLLDRGFATGEALDREEREILFQVLEYWGRGTVITFVRGADGEYADELLLETLGTVGKRFDLALAVDVASPPSAAAPVLPGSAQALERTIEEIVLRDPAVQRSLRQAVLEAPPGLRSAILDGMMSVPTSDVLEELASVLGLLPGHDQANLARIAAVAARVDGSRNPTVLSAVRGFLSRPEREVRREAIFAVAALGDEKAVGYLIELLEDQRVNAAAVEALRQITGYKFAEPERWRTWHAKEIEWFEDRAPTTIRELESWNATIVHAALIEVALHPLFQEDLADPVSRLLTRSEPVLRVKACRVLAQFGTWKHIPGLMSRLEDPKPEVKQAAREALMKITGEELPADRWAWHEFVRRQG